MAKIKKFGERVQDIFNVIPKEMRLSLAVAVGGFFAYTLYKKVNKSKKEIQEDALKSEAGQIKDPETGKVINCRGRLSYPMSWYDSQAAILKKAFWTLNWQGTDFDGVKNVYDKLRNDCDLAQLIASFGFQRQEFYFQSFDLRWWMYDELRQSQLKEINAILQKRGIQYRF